MNMPVVYKPLQCRAPIAAFWFSVGRMIETGRTCVPEESLAPAYEGVLEFIRDFRTR